MPRKNIFELLEKKWDIRDELTRIYRLFTKEKTITLLYSIFTLESFVDIYCFDNWKNRGRYINAKDYLVALDFQNRYESALSNMANLLTVIEVIYNFYYMANAAIRNEIGIEHYPTFDTLRLNMDICLEHYNHHTVYIEDKEQAIVVEINPASTSVAEISEPDTAYQIMQYNHHLLKGDIAAKKRVLLYLANEIEAKRQGLKSISKSLSDDIFSLLNNLNLRHNNCDPNPNKHYIQYVASMTEVQLEEWYDELYQMILLAMLELDHLDRKKKITELISHF